jgi:hypothetical protein
MVKSSKNANNIRGKLKCYRAGLTADAIHVSTYPLQRISAKKSRRTSSGLLGPSDVGVAPCGIVLTAEYRAPEETEAMKDVGMPTT